MVIETAQIAEVGGFGKIAVLLPPKQPGIGIADHIKKLLTKGIKSF